MQPGWRRQWGERKMVLDDFEQQIDLFLDRVFPKAAMIGCALAALYFGGHVIVALMKGWI